MEKSLAADATFLDAILHTSEDAIISIDKAHRIVLVNEGAVRLFGYRRKELLGSPIDQLIPARFRQAHRRHIKDFTAAPETSRLMGQRSDVVGRRKDGTEFPAEASITKANVEGRVLFTVILRDVTRRKEAEEALRASEERFRGLVENASDAILVLQDGKAVFRNPIYEALLGYTVAETRERTFLETIAPEDRDRVSDYHARRIRGETAPEQYEVRLVTRTGETVTMEVRPRVIAYDGRPAVLVMMRNITERKQAEEALRASEERYRRLVENARDVVIRFQIEPQLSFEYVSPAVTKMLGYSPEEFYADRGLFRRIVHPEDRPFVRSFIDNPAVQTDPLFLRYIHKDGSVVWTESRGIGVYDATGKLVAIETVTRDITAQKQAEEALRASEEKFRLLADNAGDMIYLWRTVSPHRIEYVSPACERLFGCTVDELSGEPALLLAMAHPEDRHLLVDLGHDPTTHTGRFEMRYTTKDGRSIVVEHSRTPIYDKSGDLVAVEGVARDITERKLAEETLRASEEKFRLLAENAKDIVYRYRFTKPRGFEYISPACEGAMGFTQDEILRDPNFSIIHPDDRGHLQGQDTSASWFAERPILRLNTLDGHEAWAEFARVAVRDEAGNLVAVEGTVRDVTERKLAEEALRASEERFRLLAENAHDWIFRFNLSEPRSFDYVSPACERLFGYTPEEIYRNPDIFATIVHPDDRHIVEEIRGSRLSFIEPFAVRCLTKDGRTVWIDVVRWAHYDDSGKLVAIEGSARDITGLKEAEETLRASEERFRLLAENAHDMIYRYRLAEPRGFEYVSPGSVRVSGYTPEEYYEGVATDSFQTQLVEPAQAWSTQAALTVQTFHKNGSTIWLELTRTPIYDDSGTLVAIEGIARNVTERKQAEEELAASRRRIVESQEKLRREMAEQLHGRVQNRLLVATTRIRQAIDELGDNPVSVERLTTAANVLDEVAERDLREIVNELHPMIGRVGLLAFLRTLIDGYSPSFRVDLVMPDRAWAIQTLAEPRLDKGLSLAIYRVVEEALNNVQKHANAVSARVTIEPTEHKAILVTVQDDGEGFAVDAVPPGFGLHSMADYCGVQGGSVRIESRPGSGTTVVATFPLGESS